MNGLFNILVEGSYILLVIAIVFAGNDETHDCLYVMVAAFWYAYLLPSKIYLKMEYLLELSIFNLFHYSTNYNRTNSVFLS